MVAATALLAGCSSDLAGMFRSPGKVEPGPQMDSGFARALDSASAGTMINYRMPDGTEVALTLEAPYDAASGRTCRIGRSKAKHEAYGFCRDSGAWYAVAPAVIVGR
ncbi:MAG TPA: hypothetical protein VG889_07570 [Rhizomicrobium sp.]|nr:hypothetical protein [Rhizomicrobium sp.]